MSPRLLLLPLLLAACAPETYHGPDEDEEPVRGDPVAVGWTSCDPTMSTFPVGDEHNIGYDHASCGSGTCDISCPDDNANSDWGGSHHGIDVFAYQGAPLVAVTTGQIVATGEVSSTSGLRVRLRDACGWEYYYGHMDEIWVSTGDWVSEGQVIGTMGYTGTASTHLHFNVSPDGSYYDDIDPFDLLDETSGTACEADGSSSSGGGGSTGSGSSGGTCGVATATTYFTAGDVLSSCDGRFHLTQQTDGNLVLYGSSGALWHTHTHTHSGAWSAFQGDGNLVVYTAEGSALWSSGSQGNAGAELHLQDDGNLVITDGSTPVWNSGTCCW